MEVILIYVSAGLLLASVVMTILYTHTRKTLLTLKSKYEKDPSFESRQILSDLLGGGTLVKIERIDPEGMLLRRR